MLRKLTILILLSTVFTFGGSAAAETEEIYGPYCAAFETEPAMDFGGRSVNSIQTLASGLAARTGLAQRTPAVQLAWELPMSLVLLLVQHEVMGHGSRAREYDLDPDYGFGLDFSAFTTINRNPRSTAEIATIASGGTEATAVAARRMVLDLYQPGGGEGALAPLLLMYKLDLPLYLSQTEKPRPPVSADGEFVDQYTEGNDMAIYMVSRQGSRVGADPVSVWDRTYSIDYSDPALAKTWRDVRDSAIWAVLDPAVLGSMVGYAKQHVGQGHYRIQPPVWQVRENLGLTAGTRAALGPAAVSRFLDVYLVHSRGLGNAYVRDLESTIDHTFGAGFGFHRATLGRHVKLGGQFDWWDEPQALERPNAESRWHVGAEIDVMIQRRWGVTAKIGSKSSGYLPGYPGEKGVYLGFGLLFGI